MIIKPRSAWGAAPPSAPLISIPTPTPIVYVHHSAVEAFGPSALRQFQQFHMTGKNMRDIAYNFLIDLDTTVWEGRGWNKAHGGNTGHDNVVSHSICLMGNFENKALPSGQENALVELLREGKRRGAWLLTDIRGHQQEVGASTDCPGDSVMARLPIIRARAKETISTPLPIPTKESDSMFLYTAPNQPVFFCDGGVSVGINEPSDMKTFQDAGIKMFKLDDDTFAKFRARFPGQ